MIVPEEETSDELRAPFPWFGGKRRAAHIVWERFGKVSTYNEPFAGSLAVLLGRPHAPRVETVNDLDCFIVNFWRALQAVPDRVAYFADGPVNEADLHARHRWLVTKGRRRVLRCRQDPHYFDAKIAGWWVWGQCLWIGSGWCEAIRQPVNLDRPETGLVNPKEVHAKRPKLRERGTDGVAFEKAMEASRPDLSSLNGRGYQRTVGDRSENPSEQNKRFASTGHGQGSGVHRRWQGGGQGGGSGVHAPTLTQQKPQLSGERSGANRGLLSEGVYSEGLYEYLRLLAVRLRRVRVCCGDWRRVLTPSVTTYVGICGVFLDPPYAHEMRERCYAEDHDISADVRAWALAHGDDPKMRVALCGYEGEHKMPASWECVPWKAHGGYSRTARGVENRERERIWFSPSCFRPSDSLFAGLGLS